MALESVFALLITAYIRFKIKNENSLAFYYLCKLQDS